jgi:hypothetical protein
VANADCLGGLCPLPSIARKAVESGQRSNNAHQSVAILPPAFLCHGHMFGITFRCLPLESRRNCAPIAILDECAIFDTECPKCLLHFLGLVCILNGRRNGLAGKISFERSRTGRALSPCPASTACHFSCQTLCIGTIKCRTLVACSVSDQTALVCQVIAPGAWSRGSRDAHSVETAFRPASARWRGVYILAIHRSVRQSAGQQHIDAEPGHVIQTISMLYRTICEPASWAEAPKSRSASRFTTRTRRSWPRPCTTS